MNPSGAYRINFEPGWRNASGFFCLKCPCNANVHQREESPYVVTSYVEHTIKMGVWEHYESWQSLFRRTVACFGSLQLYCAMLAMAKWSATRRGATGEFLVFRTWFSFLNWGLLQTLYSSHPSSFSTSQILGGSSHFFQIILFWLFSAVGENLADSSILDQQIC